MSNHKLISATIKSITEKKGTIVSIGWAIVDAKAKSVTVTDMDIVGIVSGCNIAGKGKIAVDAYALQRIAGATKKSLAMEITDKGLLVIADGDKYTIENAGDIDNFPIMQIGEEVETTIAAIGLSIFNVVFCASTEQTRYYLNGVYLETSADKVKTVATDGHRMAIRELPAVITGNMLTHESHTIIPRKTIIAIQSICSADVKLEFIGTKLRITSGDVVLITKLIDGNFPDYSRVVPSYNEAVTAHIDTKALLAVTSKKSVVDTRAMKIQFSATGCKAILKGDKSKLEKHITDGAFKDMEIGMNISYLDDITKDMDAGCFTISVNDPASPIKLQGDKEGSFYILMPMRT